MNMCLFRKEVLEMVSLKDYIENHTTVSIIDLLKDIDKDKVFVHSHYSSIPKDSPFALYNKRV